MEHAKLSASGSKKWLNCPQSITLESQFNDTESSFAKEGTLAHSLGELKLKRIINHMDLIEFIKQKKLIINEFITLKGEEDLKEFENYTDEYVEFVQERYNSALKVCYEATLEIEQRLDYSKWAEGGFGTGDVAICDFERIEVIDLKYGKGIKVDANYNTQLMLYGLGALVEYDMFDIKEVILTVYQPRIDNISSFTISTEELLSWAENEVKPQAIKALDGTGECVYGTHCDDGFCKARPLCKAYADKHNVEVYAVQHPKLLSKEDLVNIFDIAQSYEKWIKTIQFNLGAE